MVSPSQVSFVTPQCLNELQANEMAEGLEVNGDKAAAAQQIKNLYKLFVESDCTMVEVRFACSPFTHACLQRQGALLPCR